MEGMDGFICFRKPPKLPYIYLKEQYAPRRNFTLAHELGHLFMPWHPRQNRVCAAGEADPKDARMQARLESEADAFAGELLAPTFWIDELLAIHSLQDAFELLIGNEYLSVEAACINMSKARAPVAIVRMDVHSGIRYTSYCSKEFSKLKIGYEDFEDKAVHISRCSYGKHDLSFYLFEMTEEVRREWSRDLLGDQGRPAKDILHEILQDMPTARANGIKSSAHGCISGQNSHRDRYSDEEFFAACLRGLKAREKLLPLTSHPLFESFVSQRCRELLEKRTK